MIIIFCRKTDPKCRGKRFRELEINNFPGSMPPDETSSYGPSSQRNMKSLYTLKMLNTSLSSSIVHQRLIFRNLKIRLQIGPESSQSKLETVRAFFYFCFLKLFVKIFVFRSCPYNKHKVKTFCFILPDFSAKTKGSLLHTGRTQSSMVEYSSIHLQR